MKYFLSLLFLTVLNFNSFSQTKAELMNNPDVVWLAETSLVFNPDMNRDENQKLGIMGANAYSLKLMSLPARGKEIYEDDVLKLSEYVASHNFFSEGKQKLYYDSLLTKPIGEKERNKLGSVTDTIISFDAETFQEIQQVLVNAFDPNNIVAYKVSMLVYYHRKDMFFRSVPLSVAPLDKTGKALYWMPVLLTDKTDLNNPDVNWVKRTAYMFSLDDKKATVLKKADKDLISDYLIPDIKKHNAPVYDIMNLLGTDKIPDADVQKFGDVKDTVITFDPKTFEQIVTVIKNNITPGSIKEIRLIQDWIWDYKKHQLYIRPLGFAPIVNRYDDAGNFMNSGPMFYRREKGVE